MDDRLSPEGIEIMEQDQRGPPAVTIRFVNINPDASMILEPAMDSGGGDHNTGERDRISGQSASTCRTNATNVTSRSTGERKTMGATHTTRTIVAHQVPLTNTEKWLMNRNKLKLFFAMMLGAMAWFISSYDGANAYLYGANWEREWLWWVVAVPFYVFVAIYFARFVGSYLMRIWMWEIVNSPWVHGAVVTLLTGILSEETADDLFAAALAKPAIVGAASKLTSDVIGSEEVQDACVNTVVGTLLSKKVTDSVVSAAERLLGDPAMHRAMAALIESELFVQPIATQAARIVQSEEVVDATIGIMQDVLEHQDVRRVIKRRAESVAGDAEIYSAGRRGLLESFLGPSAAARAASAPSGRLRNESTGSTSCEEVAPARSLPATSLLEGCGPPPCRCMKI